MNVDFLRLSNAFIAYKMRDPLFQYLPGSCANESPVLDTFRAYKMMRNVAYPLACPFKYHYFQAVVVVEMDMGSAEHLVVMFMLQTGQNACKPLRMMVVYYSDGAHNFLVPSLPLALDKSGAHDIADRLGTGTITFLHYIVVESFNKLVRH